MQKSTSALIAALLLVPAAVRTQTPVASPAKTHVEFLASEKLEGREAGSQGERFAAEYLTAQLTRIGARPLPGRSDMFMPFEFTGGSRDGGSQVTVTGRTFSAPADIRALSFSDDGDVTGSVVFGGYGLIVPESQNFAYDSYAGIDVKDKIVLVLRYFPEDTDQQTRAILARYSDLRYKAMAARQRGARAMLVVTGPRSPNAGELVPMAFDTALAGSGIPAVSISGAFADALFAGAKPLRTVQEELDSGNPHVAGFDLPGVTVSVQTTLVRERHRARNVVAYLPATMPTSPAERPWIVVGAHYDHLGRGDRGTSLAGKEEAG